MPRKNPARPTSSPAASAAAPRRSPQVARKGRAAMGPEDAVVDGPDLTQRLAALAVDPIAIIAGIAADESADIKLRFAAAKELAAYLMAKPRTRQEAGTPAAVDIGAIIARAWRGHVGEAEE